LSQEIASFYAKISADTSQIQASLAALDKKMTDTKAKSSQMGGVIGDLKSSFMSMINPTTLALGAVSAIGAAIAGSIPAYEESAKIQAKLGSVLESTGQAAGITADQLNDMALALSQTSGVEDDLITNSQAVLLTFTKIKSDAFEPTMQAALDMSAVLGGDLQGSVLRLGKAMNDFSGYSALKKAGVSFTEEQIKQIEKFKATNDLVGYQNLLLKELQVEFGGAAKAMQDVSTNGNLVKNAFGNMQEAIGGANAGWISDFNRGLAYTIQGLADFIDKQAEAAAIANTAEAKTARLAAEFENLGGQVYETGRGASTMTPEFKKFVDAADQAERVMAKGVATTEFYSRGIEQVGKAAGMTEEELKSLSEANAALISGAQDILESNNDYNAAQTETITQMNELNAKKQEAIQWYGAESQAVKDIQADMDALNQKYTESADAHAEASQRKLLDMSLEAIALSDGIAGFSEAEAARAQALLETADAGAAAAFKEQQAFVTASEEIAKGTIDARELDAVLKMMAKGYSIDVVLNTLANLAAGQQAMSGGGSMLAANNGLATPGFAAGGISTGPSSGHMEMLHGTEAVIPLQNGSIPVQMESGFDVTAIINELRASRLDENRLARAIVSAMKREV
jgi:hypothetical protein